MTTGNAASWAIEIGAPSTFALGDYGQHGMRIGLNARGTVDAVSGGRRPEFLTVASRFLVEVSARALSSGRLVRIVPSATIGVSEAWPRDCWRRAEVGTALGLLQLDSESRSASPYPVSIWIVPADDEGLLRLVSVQAELRTDESVFLDCMRKGAVRIAVTDKFGDILAKADLKGVVEDWLHAAIRNGGVNAHWEAEDLH